MSSTSKRFCLIIATVLRIISVAVSGTTDTVQRGRDCCRSKNSPAACLPYCGASILETSHEFNACLDAYMNIEEGWSLFWALVACIEGTDVQNEKDEQAAREKQMHDDLERALQEQNKHWRPKAVRDFAGWSDRQLKEITGLLNDTSPLNKTTLNHDKIRLRRAAGCNAPATLPANFDWRQQRPNCQSIKHIRDQGLCGSCWAVSSASVISDRYCIVKGVDRFFSAIQLTSALENKCAGGRVGAAMDYYVNSGLVTGGDLTAGEAPGCQPYPTHFDQVPCNPGGVPPPCVMAIAPPASSACQESYGNSFVQDKQQGDHYDVITSRNVDEIMREIYCNGPVVAGIALYPDFYYYGSHPTHVYEHVPVPNNMIPIGHAVRIIGWGSDPIPHWLLANSWGTNTGLQGIYKIRRGSNEVGIEEAIFAVFTQPNTPTPNPNPTPAPTRVKLNKIHRLFNPISGDHFYTNNNDEALNAASHGDNVEGFLGSLAVESCGANSREVHRYYNPSTGDHFYTINPSGEVLTDYQYEGIIGHGSSTTDSTTQATVAVYRSYNGRDHFFTSSFDEASVVSGIGYRSEGVAWYMYAADAQYTGAC